MKIKLIGLVVTGGIHMPNGNIKGLATLHAERQAHKLGMTGLKRGGLGVKGSNGGCHKFFNQRGKRLLGLHLGVVGWNAFSEKIAGGL